MRRTRLTSNAESEAPQRRAESQGPNVASNSTMRRMIVQRQLMVGAVNDPAEREADAVAGRVVREWARHDDSAQRQLEEEELLQGKRDPAAIRRETVDEEELLQGSREASQTIGLDGGPVDSSTSAQISAARGSGNPLPDAVRAPMESALGADLSRVNVHTGARSDELNTTLQSRAFTVGSDIFFRSGDFKPDSASGRELLAHELTHVVQQGG